MLCRWQEPVCVAGSSCVKGGRSIACLRKYCPLHTGTATAYTLQPGLGFPTAYFVRGPAKTQNKRTKRQKADSAQP